MNSVILEGLVTISKVLLVDDNIDRLTIFQEGLERYAHVDKAIKLIFLTPRNEDNNEINTMTSNHLWIIRKPITVKSLFEEVISILALEQNIPLL